MIFTETELNGVYIIDIKPVEDRRGFFARGFCNKEFSEVGLNPFVAQCNLSYNATKGTLRGMHYQLPPHAEVKLVRCIRGAIYDVAVDLRPDSPTYCRWIAVELSAQNNRMLYLPEGFAHGFQTLEDHSTVYYQVSAFYAPEYERGVRWDDPAFGIEWPVEEKIISDKDRQLPDYRR